jgi:hypothetical protein
VGTRRQGGPSAPLPVRSLLGVTGFPLQIPEFALPTLTTLDVDPLGCVPPFVVEGVAPVLPAVTRSGV